MSGARSLVCWQPVLTDHQAYTYRALSRIANSPMLAFVLTLEDATRKAQGWSDTRVDSIERRIIPARMSLEYCYTQLREHRTSVHFFGSPFQSPLLMACIVMAMWLGVEFYLVSEPYSPEGVGYLADERSTLVRLKAWHRPLAYRAYVGCLRKRVAGIFAISRLAVAQYRSAGMPPDKLFPFGYFVPDAVAQGTAAEPVARPPGAAFHIVFVGALIQRKGIDILVDAVREVRRSGRNVHLDVYGPGATPDYLRQADGVAVHAPIAFGQASNVIANYDLLVLPSRYDGWGVVVNEALAAGVPVLTSDTTGAGCFAQESGAGLTFKSGDAMALAAALILLSDDAALRQTLAAATSSAAAVLQPDVAARYMWSVLCAPPGRKTAVPSPWYRKNGH
jgi:glycosyltransferase involved in cell wall biosynthesis